MQSVIKRWHILLGCSLILLTTAGCFQAIGSELQATDIAQGAPTFTPIPTLSPEPSNTPTDLPTEDVTQEVEPTQTPTPEDLTGGGQEETVDQLGTAMAIAQAPTISPGQLTAQAIETIAAQQPVEVAQEPGELSPIQLTATAIVGRATMTAGAPLTQQAIENGGGFAPTATLQPTQEVFTQPTIDVGQTNTVATAIPQPVLAGDDCVHEVRTGDQNLFRIALSYGVTYQDVAQASGIVNPDMIYIGQRLVIPGCGTTGVQPLPTSVATVVTGATAVPGTGTGAGGSYTVMQNDTLFQISLRYGVTVHQIAAANGISNIDLIYIGDVLAIP